MWVTRMVSKVMATKGEDEDEDEDEGEDEDEDEGEVSNYKIYLSLKSLHVVPHLDSATEALVHIARVHHRNSHHVSRLQHQHPQVGHRRTNAERLVEFDLARQWLGLLADLELAMEGWDS